MKKMAIRTFAVMLCICICAVTVYGTEMLVPVGQVIGMELRDDSVTVVSFDEKLGQNARTAGLCEGDRILSVNGKTVTCAQDVKTALVTSKGFVTMTVSRKGKEVHLRITPQITAEGPKLGVYLKQGVTGVGTVTFYDPDTGVYGALGHGVHDGDGNLVNTVTGCVYRAGIASVQVGRSGRPGQLRGAVSDASVIGSIEKNTAQGVFGVSEIPWQGSAIEVARSDEICTGPATILSTVSQEGVREYSVEILKIYPKGKKEGRNMLIRVTDPQLLDITGGIVQGMSGSPIIQDGKLIGAVTHVLVNQPDTGYGIFIENMLQAAG